MNREEVLAAFAAFTPDKWNRKPVIVPEELLEQITVVDLPVSVVVEVGRWFTKSWDDPPTKELGIFWRGRLVRDIDEPLWSIIRYDLFPGLWLEAVNANFYFELLRTCILNGMNAVEGLAVDKFDIGDDLSVRLDYRFPVAGANLKEAFDKARRIQHDLEAPAQQVLDNVTKRWRTPSIGSFTLTIRRYPNWSP